MSLLAFQLLSARWLITRDYTYLPEGVFSAASPVDNAKFSEDAVHLWAANLSVSDNRLESFFQGLSADEQQRAIRFRFEKDRNRFVAARGILRSLLGIYLGCDPTLVQFAYSDRGKPKLANNPLGIQFNLSHSNGMALYAVGCDRVVGVDLEFYRPLSDLGQLAKRFFSQTEYKVLTSLVATAQHDAFFHLWTCKEAYLKATGEGLTGLGTAELRFDSSCPFQIAGLMTQSQQSFQPWKLVQLQPFPDFVAALAVQGSNFQLQCGHVGEMGAIASLN
ncbi:phosphopantetheinyl transferase [Leptolyngbyaceae cyanobacterium JSC-12]|nr:phosphopantetheinyl transferase [Leptolyngbyaceae cyanobacterium JSC-12]